MELPLLDKIKRLVIIALVADDELMEKLVLKGGNAISIAYEVGNRGSADLDFSMADDFEDLEATFATIERSLVTVFAEEGLHAFDVRWQQRPSKLAEHLKSFWGGYLLEFKLTPVAQARQHADDLAGLRRNSLTFDAQQNRKFTVDISPFEYCELKVEKTLNGYTYYVYPPQLVVFEKLRAICQQIPAYSEIVGGHKSTGRARDFYDIYTLAHEFTIDSTSEAALEALRQVFGAKRVPESYLATIADYRELHRADYKSVEANVTAGTQLLGFDAYFDFVVTHFSHLLEPSAASPATAT
jgi:predicted nucleotidyltransferase component of viral defense system